MDNIVQFLTASALLTIMPGPDIIFVSAQSIAVGRKAAIAVSLGLASGLLVHTAAAAAGISLIIASSPVLFNIIKYAGIAYLIYIGIMELRSNGGSDKPEGVQRSFGKLYRIGVTMNLLNPKVILFFLAFLPQFLAKDGFRPVDVVILGILFAIQAAVIFCGVSIAGGFMSGFINGTKINGRTGGIIKASIYWLIALCLIVL